MICDHWKVPVRGAVRGTSTREAGCFFFPPVRVTDIMGYQGFV